MFFIQTFDAESWQLKNALKTTGINQRAMKLTSLISQIFVTCWPVGVLQNCERFAKKEVVNIIQYNDVQELYFIFISAELTHETPTQNLNGKKKLFKFSRLH